MSSHSEKMRKNWELRKRQAIEEGFSNPNKERIFRWLLSRPSNFSPYMIYRYMKWVVIPDTYSCWDWDGSSKRSGYGQIGKEYTGNNREAGTTIHRMSYELFYGEIPEHLHVCHACDNPPCSNPKHLFLGTSEDNMKDAARKGRLGGWQAKRNLAICEKFFEGWNIPKLAKHFRLPQKHIRALLVSRGIIKSKKDRMKVRRKKLVKLLKEGYLKSEVADILGVHASQITRDLKFLGLSNASFIRTYEPPKTRGPYKKDKDATSQEQTRTHKVTQPNTRRNRRSTRRTNRRSSA